MPLLVGLLIVSPFLGTVFAVIVWQEITRRNISQGFVLWGFLSGLSFFVLLNSTTYWVFVYFLHRQRDVFYGHSTNYGDGPVGLDIFLWAIGAFLGFIVYLGLTIFSAKRLSKEIPRRLPPNWKRWVVGITAVFLLIPTGYFLFMAYQRQSIKTAVPNLSQPITTWELEEIGLLPQSGVSPLEPFPDYVYHIQISQNGRWALLEHEKQIDLFDLASFQVAQTFSGKAMTATFSPDSLKLIVVNPYTSSLQEVEPYLLLYDVEKGAVLWQDGEIRAFAGEFLLNGAELFVVGHEKAWQVEAENGRIVNELDLMTYVERSISPDTNFLAVQNGETITIFNASQTQVIAEFPQEQLEHLKTWGYRLQLLTFLTNTEVLIRLGDSYQRLMWNFQTGQTNILPYPLEYIKISPDGRFIVHQNSPFLGDRMQNVVDTQTNQPLPWPTETAVGAAAFTPDQKLLILATFDGYLRFFAQDTPLID